VGRRVGAFSSWLGNVPTQGNFLLLFSTLNNNKNCPYTRKPVNQYSEKDKNRAYSCERANYE
jgi:hypothetical protein